MQSTPSQTRLRQRILSDKASCLGLIVGFAMLSLAYLLAVPPLEGPDAGAHFAYAQYLAAERRAPLLHEAASISHEAIQQPPLYYAVVALVSDADKMRLAQEYAGGSPLTVLDRTHKGTVLLPGIPKAATMALDLARAVSWLGGLLCVVATWYCTRIWLPEEKLTALLAASIVACNPVFLFQSTAITNDAWVAGLSSGAVMLTTMAATRPRSRWWLWLCAGACAALATLTKLSGLFCALPMAVIWIDACLGRKRAHWHEALCLVAGFGVVAGPWFVRNIVQYGQIVPLDTMMKLLPGLARTEPIGLAAALQELPWVWRTYWGGFGMGTVAPDGHAVLVNAFAALGLVGIIVGLARDRWHRGHCLLLIVSLTWLLPTVGSLIKWIMTVNYTNQGRLLFPAASALASLLSLGWAGLWPQDRDLRVIASIGMGVLLVGLAAWPLLGLYRDYRTPPPIQNPNPQRTLNHTFSNGAQIIGMDLAQGGRLVAGNSFPIEIYWSCSDPIENHYLVYVQVVDDQDNKLFYHDGLAFDHYATPEWIPGQVFGDNYDVVVSEVPASGMARIIIGMRGIQGSPFDEQIVAAPIRIVPSQTMAAVPQMVSWSNGIGLADYSVSWPQIDACQVDLVWTASLPIHTDYSMSIQFLDASGSLVAQLDGQPADYPTSTWAQGDRFVTSLTMPDIPSSWQRTVILLYDGAGVRLLLHDSDADTMVLDTR